MYFSMKLYVFKTLSRGNKVVKHVERNASFDSLSLSNIYYILDRRLRKAPEISPILLQFSHVVVVPQSAGESRPAGPGAPAVINVK